MKLFYSGLMACTLLFTSCKTDPKPADEPASEKKEITLNEDGTFFKMSLAQWSLHEPILAGEMSPLDFAKTAKELGFDGVELENRTRLFLYHEIAAPAMFLPRDEQESESLMLERLRLLTTP